MHKYAVFISGSEEHKAWERQQAWRERLRDTISRFESVTNMADIAYRNGWDKIWLMYNARIEELKEELTQLNNTAP